MTMSEVREWQLQDAKNKFSEVVKLAQLAPQMVKVRGKLSAVVISFDDYHALTQPKQSLIELMTSAPKGFAELDISRSDDHEM